MDNVDGGYSVTVIVCVTITEATFMRGHGNFACVTAHARRMISTKKHFTRWLKKKRRTSTHGHVSRLWLWRSCIIKNVTFGFGNIEQKSLQLYKSKAKQWKQSNAKKSNV